MDIERFHAVVRAFMSDLSGQEIVTSLNNLFNSLKKVNNDPANTDHQQDMSNKYKHLLNALQNSELNSITPSDYQILNELNLTKFLPNNLESSIRGIFEKNQITPTIAVDELSTIQHDLQATHEQLNAILVGFQHLDIPLSSLDPGSAEAGALVPREHFKNNLQDLSKELKEINQIFGTFNEIVTNQRPPLTIRTLSTTDVSLLIDYAPEVAAFVSWCVKNVIDAYKKILEIRKLRRDLSEKDLPQEALKPIDDAVDQQISERIDQITAEAFEKFRSGNDDGRDNELKTELRQTLKKIADRIDRGYNFEVRMAAPEPVDEEDDDETENANQRSQNAEAFELIERNRRDLGYLRTEGDPILHLASESRENKDQSRENDDPDN